MTSKKSSPGSPVKKGASGFNSQDHAEILELRRKVAELESLEQARRETMSALTESELRFRTVFENVASGILMTDPSGKILTANAPALRILGLKDTDRGKRLDQVLPQAARLFSARSARGQHRMELEVADGQRKYLSFTNEPVALPEGKGTISLFQDIGQVYQAEERKRRAEQLAYVGELAARLSHEIKNPLATIQAGLKLLIRQLKADEENLETLTIVNRDMESIAQMISGLLNAARAEPFHAEQVTLGPLLQEASSIFYSLAQGKGLDLSLHTQGAEVQVMVDKKAFSRTLGNLVHNAIEALSRGGWIKIEGLKLEALEVEKQFPGYPGEVACVWVTDNGPGIAEEVAKHIFEPFFTTKKSGTGLGLAVARDIVDAHGGVMVMKSPPGEGACFEIQLAAGWRSPCWEWVVYHEWEIYYGEDRCASCEVRKSGSGQLCWTRKLVEASQEIPGLTKRRLQCPVFLSGNLNQAPLENLWMT